MKPRPEAFDWLEVSLVLESDNPAADDLLD